uniref:Uncharacterized protein n=1 Tax=Fundulus heteroclitus TaxID=8078 RepID=A0A146UA82_FUNHE
MRNFVKFHLMKFPMNPPVFDFKYLKRGWASDPFTSILENISNCTPISPTNFLISGSGHGSCEPNWLQGKPRILRPFEWYFSWSSWRWLYSRDVKAHLHATLVIIQTLPLYLSRSTRLPSISMAAKS